MIRLNVLLLAAVIASAMVLIQTAYEGRRLYAALDRAKNELVQLEADHKRLDAERQAQATHLRVERVAREKLAMRPATPAVTQYVQDGGTAPEAAR